MGLVTALKQCSKKIVETRSINPMSLILDPNSSKSVKEYLYYFVHQDHKIPWEAYSEFSQDGGMQIRELNLLKRDISGKIPTRFNIIKEDNISPEYYNDISEHYFNADLGLNNNALDSLPKTLRKNLELETGLSISKPRVPYKYSNLIKRKQNGQKMRSIQNWLKSSGLSEYVVKKEKKIMSQYLKKSDTILNLKKCNSNIDNKIYSSKTVSLSGKKNMSYSSNIYTSKRFNKPTTDITISANKSSSKVISNEPQKNPVNSLNEIYTKNESKEYKPVNISEMNEFSNAVHKQTDTNNTMKYEVLPNNLVNYNKSSEISRLEKQAVVPVVIFLREMHNAKLMTGISSVKALHILHHYGFNRGQIEGDISTSLPALLNESEVLSYGIILWALARSLRENSYRNRVTKLKKR